MREGLPGHTPNSVRSTNTKNAITGPHGESRSTSFESKVSRATSGRSSAYRMVHEVALARKTLLGAQTDARQAMTWLTESKGEYHTITTEIKAVQEEMRKTTERNLKNQEVQVAKVDAMGCRIAEITDVLTQQELRMETQMRDMCAQI